MATFLTDYQHFNWGGNKNRSLYISEIDDRNIVPVLVQTTPAAATKDNMHSGNTFYHDWGGLGVPIQR
eukprot:527786-Amphidinium_carterae.1